LLKKEFLEPDYPFNQNSLKEIDFDDFLNNVTIDNLNKRLDCLVNIIQSINAILIVGKSLNSNELDYEFLEQTLATSEMVFLGLSTYKKKITNELPKNIIVFIDAINRKRGIKND
jgi:hypothetical protein